MTNQDAPILIVEDDKDLGGILAEYLKIKGFEVNLVGDAETAMDIIDQDWLIAILDVSLPGESGFAVAEKLRKLKKRTPFLFLTAKSQKKDKLHGLELGADDYITKPFEVEELVLRIRNILNRSGSRSSTMKHIDNLELDCDNMHLRAGNKSFDLTEKEVKLLALFIENNGQLLKRDYILNEIWGDDDYFNGRSMDVFISRVRKYLSYSKRLSLINVRGVGFRLKAD